MLLDFTDANRHSDFFLRRPPLTHRFVYLQLDVGLEAEQLVLSRGGEGLGAVREQEEVVEEESPQLPAAFGFVKPAAVQQLARPEAVGQRVKDQVLKQRRVNINSNAEEKRRNTVEKTQEAAESEC